MFTYLSGMGGYSSRVAPTCTFVHVYVIYVSGNIKYVLSILGLSVSV